MLIATTFRGLQSAKNAMLLIMSMLNEFAVKKRVLIIRVLQNECWYSELYKTQLGLKKNTIITETTILFLEK